MITTRDIYKLYDNCAAPEIIHAAYREVATDNTDDYNCGRTPLHLATRYVDAKAISILLERGAEANAKDKKGNTPLLYLALREGVCGYLKDAPQGETRRCAELLLQANASVICSAKGTTALIVAADEGNYELVEAIVATNARLDSTNNSGLNALHSVCRGAGSANDNLLRTKRIVESFETKFFTERRKEEVLKEMEWYENKKEAYFNSVKTLLDSGRIDTEEKDSCGKTPLDWAIELGVKHIGALLSGNCSEMNVVALQLGGMSLLDALKIDDIEAITALLQLGTPLQTSFEEPTDSYYNEQSPLSVACRKMNPLMANLLLNAGADPNYKSVKGETAIASWMKSRSLIIGDQKKAIQEILRLLSSHGLRENDTINEAGETALVAACRYSSDLCLSIAEYFIQIGADVNRSDSQGRTPLINLCQKPYEENIDIITQLLESGAEINSTDNRGNTPMHYIASQTNKAAKDIAELIFDFGKPSMEAVNNEGKTPLAIAAETGNDRLVKLFLMNS